MCLTTAFNFIESSYLDWGIPPLITFNNHFQRYANLDSLVPLLCECGLLQTSELEILLEYSRRTDKVSYLLAILDKKGRAGVCGVIRCLKEDGMHLGHQDLASILQDHYQRYCCGTTVCLTIHDHHN